MAKRKQNGKLITAACVAVVLILSIVIGHFWGGNIKDKYSQAGLRDSNVSADSTMYVNFIDVGQGDCTLITSADTAILIDGGEAGEAQTVINYLKNQNIDDIDCLIATHPHSDHIGSLSQVMTEFKVENLIMPEIPEKILPTTGTYEKFLSTVNDKVSNVIAAKAGSTYSYGEINIQILAPLKDYEDLNNMSVVAKITYGTTSVMMTGDASFDSENDMLKQNADYKSDILKVGHHGSKTATSDKWLSAVSPKYAVISCGKGNDYGHPNADTLKRLDKHSVEYFRTDLLGSIVFKSDGKEIVKCE
jgi:competence protein ComEC